MILAVRVSPMSTSFLSAHTCMSDRFFSYPFSFDMSTTVFDAIQALLY